MNSDWLTLQKSNKNNFLGFPFTDHTTNEKGTDMNKDVLEGHKISKKCAAHKYTKKMEFQELNRMQINSPISGT